MAADSDRRAIADLGPWFHNLHLPGGLQTCPEHWAGDFPRWKWLEFEGHIPSDLRGWRVLDIGCNAGFYSFELARRGADVLGIDIDPHYLAQARWAAGRLGLDTVRFARRQLYEIDAAERFDLILFMGVFYHLRYPLLALDLLARLRPQLLVFQTLTQGSPEISAQARENCDFATRDRLGRANWPHLAFIETTFCGDPTNWWVPNRAAVIGLLRAAGFVVLAQPGEETWLCTSAGVPASGPAPDGFDAALARCGSLAPGQSGSRRSTP
jgi:tRNA (mo5U34)-methyltransferase